MNEYVINNNYGYQGDYESYLTQLIDFTLNHEQIKKVVFSIIFVSDNEIQKLNHKYRGINQITDVLSFAFEANVIKDYNRVRALGDIYVCIPQMKRQALEQGHSEAWELSFLVAHGLLHLLGYDHQTQKDAQRMLTLQELILNGTQIT